MERMYTYKFRLYPTDEQKVFLSKVFGCCRLVYNHFLHEKKEQYEQTKSSDDKQLIEIDRFYPSSQMCSECGHIEKSVRNLNIREWTCCNCGCHHDRDVNAARNILRYDSARNAENSRGVVKQLNEKSCQTSDCSDNCEAIIELDNSQD